MSASQPHAGHRSAQPWWADAVGYQVYLPSFQDADGDGWGDLDGLTSRLDYLVDLSVDIVWVTPFFVSPMLDHGYDVADYLRVDPRFGGDAALDRLLVEAHQRGLRVIGDLVVNHTSDRHAWFRSAVTDPAGPHRDYYIWRAPAPDGGPPNNWLSHFGGPAWTLDEASGQYYLHLFRPEQPDLNWRNPDVGDEVDRTIEHWLSRGLDGFRIDTAAYLLKHPDLPDNPPLPDDQLHPIRGVTEEWRRQDHQHDIHQPDVAAIHARWRCVADRHDAFLVGEVYELDPVRLAAFVSTGRLHSSFWFGLVEGDWEPEPIGRLLPLVAAASPHLSWVQGNHDRPRAVSRYGGGPVGVRRWIALQVLATFLPGLVWIYQGEELGLVDGVVAPESGVDPLGAAQPSQSRDGARTPMPWTTGSGLGFTTGQSWLPAGRRKPADAVQTQEALRDSPLQLVKQLLALRRQTRQLISNRHETDWSASIGDLLIYRRGGVTVAANLGIRPQDLPTVDGDLVFDSDSSGEASRPIPEILQPCQAIVLAG